MLLTVVLSAPQAGTVEQATLVAEPQMQVKDGAVQGCGYRLKAIPSSLAGLTSVVVLDTSFNLYESGLGLLKGGALQIPIKEGKPSQATSKQIESFWLKVQSEKPTKARSGKVVAAETKGYLLYGVSVADVSKLFGAIVEGTPITVGVRIKGESIDRIYVGAAQLSDQDKEQGSQCLDDLIKQMTVEPPSKPGSK